MRPRLLRKLAGALGANPREARLANVIQFLVAAGTLGLAVTSFCQIRQASRSAAAMEYGNRVSVAIARSASAPRFSLTFAGFDSITKSGDTATCWLRVRVQNVDTKPIRIVSVYCRANADVASIAGLLQSARGTDSLIQVADTADFPSSVQVRLPRSADSFYVAGLHVCAALRLDGSVGTTYVERVYLLVSVPTDVHPMLSHQFEYTGAVNGASVRLDPWCEQKPFWPWRKAGKWDSSADTLN
jgi:hypothetical protein